MTGLYEALLKGKEIELHDICHIKPYIEEIKNMKIETLSVFQQKKDFPFRENFEAIYQEQLAEQFQRDKSSMIDMINHSKMEENEQIFETEVVLGRSTGYIRYLFPIVYANMLIKQAELIPVSMEVSKLYEYTQFIVVDPHYENIKEEPVVLLEYPYAVPGFFVLDGNHRINKAYHKGQKQHLAHVLSKGSINLIAPQRIFVLLSTIHHNLSMIALYMAGDIILSQLKEWYQPIANEEWTS
ncbi:hypothetical protein CVD28_00200 [Bacillus sp. M6-12]|nr:hypothetical protein CVD28_00200 [Bacillus sp. M6-12]